jgi:histidyl-tRNA synthetase
MVSTRPPSGLRDFFGSEAQLRHELMTTIARVYQSFGFLPLETPAFENLDVLMGSGGGAENEKLIFKILKRGDKLKSALESSPTEQSIADFGLRFDMTVPLSRVVAEYRGQIQLPFKAFHMGPVWRAERAQKGRFREFIQCDVDIVGAKSSRAETDVIQAVCEVLRVLHVEGFELRLNDRRLLSAIGSSLGLNPDEFESFAILLDKRDKMEPQDLLDEMKALLGARMNDLVARLLKDEVNLESLKSLAPDVVEEVSGLLTTLQSLTLPLSGVYFDASLVRGLGYYTGSVFELRHSSAGYSFGGGGRYDGLIGRFSKEAIPAVGFSIGFERLFLLYKEQKQASLMTQREGLCVTVMDEAYRGQLLSLSSQWRAQNLAVSVYPDMAKLKNQLKWASDQGYRWVVIAGSQEFEQNKIQLKDLSSGQEILVSPESLKDHLVS